MESITINQATLEFIRKNLESNVHELALGIHKNKDVDAGMAIAQIQGYQALRKKVPSWCREGILFPSRHLSLEQCSSEAAALYKKTLIERSSSPHGSFMDLTGGLGIDLSFIAVLFKDAVYVERQRELRDLAEHNFRALGLDHARCVCCDCEEELANATPKDWIMLDPARRSSSGSKTVLLEDCEPDVLRLKDRLLEKAPNILLKLSPMLDATRAIEQLECVSEAHIVSVMGECKELLLILSRDARIPTEEIPFHCVNITTAGTDLFRFTRKEESGLGPCLMDRLGTYLYEPNASIMKAGCFNSISKAFNLDKVEKNSHLFTSDILTKDFPGRVFRIKGLSSMNKKELKLKLSGISKANIAVRNFPLGADELRKKLGIKDGGDTYLFATTLNGGEHSLILCEKV